MCQKFHRCLITLLSNCYSGQIGQRYFIFYSAGNFFSGGGGGGRERRGRGRGRGRGKGKRGEGEFTTRDREFFPGPSFPLPPECGLFILLNVCGCKSCQTGVINCSSNECILFSTCINKCAADFSLLNLLKGKSLGRSKPATNS